MTLKIVSYAYFRSPTSQYEKLKGDASLQFEQFIKMLVRAHHVIWRGWEMRLHVDDHVKTLPSWPMIERYSRVQIESWPDRPHFIPNLLSVVHCGPAEELCKSMLWRMIPAFQGQNKIVACRDVDSVPMPRDRAAVEEWLRTDKTVHCIHDASAHSGVMGGTTTVRSHRFQQLVEAATMERFLRHGRDLDWTKQGADQHLLNRLLPLYAQETLVHELHHRVNDMGPVEVRDKVGISMWLPYITPEQMDEADKLCPIIGGCTDPVAAFEFYDSIDFPERELIRRCER